MFEVLFTASLLIFMTWLLFSASRARGKFSRSPNMAVFEIKNSGDFFSQSLPEIFHCLHNQKWNRFLFGGPYIALEKIVRPGEVRRFVALPKTCEKVLQNNPGFLKAEESAIPRNKFYSAAYLSRLAGKINFESPKLHEDEGAALQVLIRRRDYGPGKVFLESNLKLLVWADSQERAKKILGMKSNPAARLDFFHRIFENRHRLKVSLKELKEYLA